LNDIEGVHFIAMQYVEGRTSRLVMDGPRLRSALSIAIQVADALDAAQRAASSIATSKPATSWSRRQVRRKFWIWPGKTDGRRRDWPVEFIIPI